MVGERIDLGQEDLPRSWYNILPDLPAPLPAYRLAESGEEVRSLPEIFTRTASKLEFSDERWIDIPDEVRSAYIHCGRPRPLIRARRLEELLGSPARIYFKCEDLPPAGTFKTNAALPQAYWAMREGRRRIVFAGSPRTRTHFALAYAARAFGLTPTVFMARGDCEEHGELVLFLRKMLGAEVRESPSRGTEFGRGLLEERRDHPGSTDIAREEAVEEARKSGDAAAVASSFLNHVLLTQTIIGLEVEKQLAEMDERPDVLVAPVGGGSNLYGLIAPFLRDRINGKLPDVRFLAVESEVTAKLTDGAYGYVPMQSPMKGILAKMYELDRRPLPEIAGAGIQTINTAPLLSLIREAGLIETAVYPADEEAVLEAARIFLGAEGYLVSPESAYAVKGAMDEALKAKRRGEGRTIVLSVSAVGYLDFGEKDRYLSILRREL